MTYRNLPDLAPERWGWSWHDNTPRRLLTDGLGNELAEVKGARRNDYLNVHESFLPFLAYELDALAFETGGTVYARRQALVVARELNQEIGTEAAFYTLIGLNRAAGYHQYSPAGKPKTGVELFITPPIDRAADPEFILYITDRAKRVWPYTLEVIAIHILSVSTATFTIFTASSTIDYSGWPYGS